MFFEGSEKKIEIIFDASLPSLREKPESFYKDLVATCRAQILSKVSNEHMDAYLLSESSLFVYDHYLIMITCGQTQLIHSAEYLLKHFGAENMQAFFYERKNEVFPHEQPTNIFADLDRLKNWFPGKSLRFGREDEHHLYLHSTDKAYSPSDDDHTMEILMHGVQSEQIDTTSLVKGKIDDHKFEPVGYSLNSIDGPHYYTIHVTPEKIGNYTSFETNSRNIHEQPQLAKKVLDAFKPTTFDIVLFNKTEAPEPKFEDYILRKSYVQKISSGYTVQYFSYYQPQCGSEPAFEL